MAHTISGRDHFYKRQVISNSEFTEQPTFAYGFNAQHLILVNDGKFPLIFSFNGEDVDGEVFRCDKMLSLAWKGHSKIWLKLENENTEDEIRIWAWVE